MKCRCLPVGYYEIIGQNKRFNIEVALRTLEPEKRCVHVEIIECLNGFTGIESRNRCLHVEISECGNDFTGIESRKSMCTRRNK